METLRPVQCHRSMVCRRGDELVDSLESHKTCFTNLKSTGGSASVIIQFLGDGYLADEIPHATLAKLVDLELALAIDCFVDPQS
jgi:hypothetical protein